MKSITYRYITLLFLAFYSFYAYSQQDRFHAVSDMYGKDIYVTNNTAANVAFLMIDGKVKPASKVKNVTVAFGSKCFKVESTPYIVKKKQYVVLKDKENVYLLKEEDAPIYLSTFRSKSYWQSAYDALSGDYTYLDFKKGRIYHSAKANVVYDDLTEITWSGFDMEDEDILMYFREAKGEEQKIKFSSFNECKDVVFLKDSQIQSYIDKYNARIAEEQARIAREKREKEIQDSIYNCKLRLAIAKEDNVYGSDSAKTYVDKGDTIAIFMYDKNRNLFKGRFRYSVLLFSPEDIKFVDSHQVYVPGQYSWQTKYVDESKDADFLKEQGEIGVEDRFIVAAEYDDTHTEIYLAQLNAAIKAVKDEEARRKKQQIFITGIGYSYDDNSYSSRFGMFFDVYNCFSKNIKYIEFTMTNYNAVGDVQRDDIGRSSAKVTGIGPIEPGEGGRYDFDDVFWDDRDVIRKTKLTNVKILFTDGTSKSFSGAANIEKHFTDDAWDADNE